MIIEQGRVRNDNLLTQLVQQGARRNTECNNLNDFLKSQPPTFAYAKEPLDADDWLRALERKFAALHVPAADKVFFVSPCVEPINLGYTTLEDYCDPLYLWVIRVLSTDS